MKKPTLLISLLPIIILITIIIFGVKLFGDNLTSGPSQVALITSAIIGAFIAMYHLKIPWEKIEESIIDNLGKTGSAILILLMIGALTAAWIQSGVVPAMIYYGLKIIHPSIFLVVVFLFTAIVSLVIGSSWTTVGTIGVAMLGIGEVLGFHLGWLAGAIISGAYFGDKISPLSDTTNLAASISGTNLYTHVKYMLVTNIPALIITAIVFTIVGFTVDTSSSLDIHEQCSQIAQTYNISPWLLLIPLLTIFMIYKKMSPFITLFISALFGAIIALIIQPNIISQISPYPLDSPYTYLYAPLKMLSSNIEIHSNNEMLSGLINTKGMSGMLNTIWLILCVVVFGGVMEAGGYIAAVTEKLSKLIKNTTSLVASTVCTSIFCNLTLSDQYMSIIITGKMLSKSYKDGGYEPRLLSRSIEDSATVTSVLIPWNTCGVVQSSVLGIPTLVYLPYCIFNIISPFCSIICAAIGYKIYKNGKLLLQIKK